MLKPEKVVRFYAYTTKLHIDDLATALMEFDDVHVEPPEGLPGIRPPEDVETADLDTYDEITRALERTCALSGVSLEEILAKAKSTRSEQGYKELISVLDDLVGKYLSLQKELELARKAKSLLKERESRIKELEEKITELELKIKEYYAAALEITEEDPSKLRLGRYLLEIDRNIFRASSLINATLDPSMSVSDVHEIIKNTFESLNEIKARISDVEDEIPNKEELEKVKESIRSLESLLNEVRREIHSYLDKRGRLSEMKAVESMWNKMRDTVRRVPELSPILAEREPAIAKVTQQIARLEDEIREKESLIRSKLMDIKRLVTEMRKYFTTLRDELLSIKVVAAGEAEQRVLELIENAKPIISERGKLEEEIEKLRRISKKEERGKLEEEIEKLRRQIMEISSQLAAIALNIRPKALLQKLKTMIYQGEEVAVISGWVPVKTKEKFEKDLRNKLQNYIAVEFEEVKRAEGTPSKIKLPNILKPVTLLTHRLYGLPSIYELDPTAITALFFPLMFGMMYGDVGHGLTLALFGAVLYGRSRGALKELAGILIYSGIAAAFFGYLYGMVFFIEFTEPIISPLHDTTKLMAVALTFGALEMMVGFVMNTVNKLIEGDVFAALFEYKGLATLIMYAGAVFAAIRNNADIGGTLTDPLFQAMAIPLFVTILSPIVKSVKEGHGVGEGASEAIATFLESTLALLSNSLSYIRLAAFAVIHEIFGVLTAQVIVGKEIVTSGDIGLLLAPTSLIGFAFMNIAVMGLEGMISFIQATRLTFYEFFSKFYKAAGREFRKISELLGPFTS